MFEPRASICATVFVIMATLFSNNWYEIGGLLALLLAMLILSEVPINRFGRNLLLVSWLVVFTVGAHLIGENSAGQSLQQGVRAGGIAAFRLFLVVGWGTLLGHAASPFTLVAALERLLSPLKRIGLPVHSFSVVAMLSLRFLPILAHEQQMLVRTHIARGIDIPHEPRRTRIKLYVLMCVPLLTHLFRRVEHLSAAMESRAFQVRAARTVLRETSLRTSDYALISGSALLLGGIAIL